MPGGRIAEARDGPGMRRTRRSAERVPAVAIGNRGGTCSLTQPSSVATSGATPRGAGNDVASSAGDRSITVSRVSMLVPCLAIDRASRWQREKTTRPRSCNRTKASMPDRIVGGEARAGNCDQAPAVGEPRQAPTRYAARQRPPCGDRRWRRPRMAGSSARRSA